MYTSIPGGHDNKGAYIYYVITLGGVGGPGSLDYIDYALRGGGG